MPELTVRYVYQECQKGLHSHGKLLKTLLKIYNQTETEKFWEEFIYHLKFSLIIYKREPAVERTLDFVAKFATSFSTKEKKDEEEENKEKEKPEGEEGGESEGEEEEIHPFTLRLFNFLLLPTSHNSWHKSVRFRSCLMVNKLLNNMSDDAQIDEELYDKIYDCMLQRLRDKYPMVRIQAVFALSRLQDPTDTECPIIEAYLFLLGCDPNSDVRRSVLTCIAASVKTLPALMERTRDTKDTVRRLAFQVLSEKVHIKALTIAQRVKLIHDGLNDRVDSVRESCSTRLIQAWLRLFQGNMLGMLKCLDVESCLETVLMLLKTTFKKVPGHELVANFDLLNEEHVLPVEELTPEHVLYWRALCQHIRTLGTEGEELMDKVLPPATDVCKYINSIFELMKAEQDIDKQITNEFMLHQLLLLTGTLDLSDEVGRRNLAKLTHDLLVDEKIGHSLVAPLLARYKDLYTDPEKQIKNLVEVISEIREPITSVQEEANAQEQRNRDLKLAGIRVELNQLREELEQAVDSQEFARAAEIKAKVTELEANKQSLQQEATPKTQEVRQEKNDPQTLLKCLTIAAEMTMNVQLKGLIPELQTLIEVLIIPGIQNEDPAVRNMAVKSLGLCCLMHKDTAKAHLLLFIQMSQMDQDAVKVTALQVIFDLLLTFGLEAFQVDAQEEDSPQDTSTTKGPNDSTENAEKSINPDESINESDADTSDFLGQENKEGEEEEAAKKKQSATASSLLGILCSLLDSDSSEVRTVASEGLSKLLLSARIVSPKLLSRLLLLWYNPITEDDTLLRHCLGAFFPVYAFASKYNQEVVEECVLPTLRTLFGAPASSPLAEIQTPNVVELLVQLTNIRHIRNLQKDTSAEDSCCHDSLAVKVCNEILSEPNSFNVRVLVTMLNSLELTPTHVTALKDLRVLGQRMLKEVKDKSCVKSLEKFQRTIKDLLTAQKGSQSSVADDSLDATTAEGDTTAATAGDTTTAGSQGEATEGKTDTEDAQSTNAQDTASQAESATESEYLTADEELDRTQFLESKAPSIRKRSSATKAKRLSPKVKTKEFEETITETETETEEEEEQATPIQGSRTVKRVNKPAADRTEDNTQMPLRKQEEEQEEELTPRQGRRGRQASGKAQVTKDAKTPKGKKQDGEEEADETPVRASRRGVKATPGAKEDTPKRGSRRGAKAGNEEKEETPQRGSRRGAKAGNEEEKEETPQRGSRRGAKAIKEEEKEETPQKTSRRGAKSVKEDEEEEASTSDVTVKKGAKSKPAQRASRRDAKAATEEEEEGESSPERSSRRKGGKNKEEEEEEPAPSSRRGTRGKKEEEAEKKTANPARRGTKKEEEEEEEEEKEEAPATGRKSKRGAKAKAGSEEKDVIPAKSPKKGTDPETDDDDFTEPRGRAARASKASKSQGAAAKGRNASKAKEEEPQEAKTTLSTGRRGRASAKVKEAESAAKPPAGARSSRAGRSTRTSVASKAAKTSVSDSENDEVFESPATSRHTTRARRGRASVKKNLSDELEGERSSEGERATPRKRSKNR